MQAIVDAPAPRNLQELRLFLGLLNYYAKYIPNLALMLHLLYMLLRARQPWKWLYQCHSTFKKAKENLTQVPVLMHCDPALPLVLAADASAYRFGAVLSHRLPDGSERPLHTHHVHSHRAPLMFSKKISSVPLWQALHSYDRQQTTNIHPWP